MPYLTRCWYSSNWRQDNSFGAVDSAEESLGSDVLCTPRQQLGIPRGSVPLSAELHIVVVLLAFAATIAVLI